MKPVLTIAGFDPSAGAGVLADVKTMQAHGCYGMAVNTVQTFQNEERFMDAHWVHPGNIFRQLDLLLENHSFDFIKIGVIESVFILEKVVKKVKKELPESTLVWDPVLSSSAGYQFIDLEDKDHLMNVLKKVDIITPNRQEVELLTGNSSEGKLSDLPVNMVITSWKKDENQIEDLVVYDGKSSSVKAPLKGTEKHGTGCVYSSALLCSLAKGNSLENSVEHAQKYTGRFRESGEGLIGKLPSFEKQIS